MPENRNPFNDKKKVTTSSSAKDAILATIAEANDDAHESKANRAQRNYLLAGTRSLDERVELLKDRLIDYRASVTESTSAEVPALLQRLLEARGASSVVVSADFPDGLLQEVRATVRRDEPALSTSELDDIDATIVGCAVAIAQTGTIVLDSGELQGRRALSLVPDHLIVLINDDQIVELVPEALPRLRPNDPQTWISGPSATSDIELERIEGVHGPRILDVVLVRS